MLKKNLKHFPYVQKTTSNGHLCIDVCVGYVVVRGSLKVAHNVVTLKTCSFISILLLLLLYKILLLFFSHRFI